MTKDVRRELVEFLVRRAFDPVLAAKGNGRSEADKVTLERVQKATRAEIDRFRGYGSAEEVVLNFKRDLNSKPAKRIHSELKGLNLPTINDLREEFERKMSELDIPAE